MSRVHPAQHLYLRGSATEIATQSTAATGTITGVSPSFPLTGGGSSGSVSLGLTGTCGNGQVLQWNGAGWVCATVSGSSNFNQGVNINVTTGQALSAINNDANSTTVHIENDGGGRILEVSRGGASNSNVLKVDNVGVEIQTLVNKITNDAGGTTLNKLAKFTSSGTVVTTTTSDRSGVLGIVVSGAGTTGDSYVAFSGVALCVFDNTPTIGQYVTISSSVTGDCHAQTDAGDPFPTDAGQVLGRVIPGDTTPPVGQGYVYLIGPEVHGDISPALRAGRNSGTAPSSASVTWSPAFADANYTVTCTSEGASAGPAVITSHVAASVTASVSGTGSYTLHCIAFHD